MIIPSEGIEHLSNEIDETKIGKIKALTNCTHPMLMHNLSNSLGFVSCRKIYKGIHCYVNLMKKDKPFTWKTAQEILINTNQYCRYTTIKRELMQVS